MAPVAVRATAGRGKREADEALWAAAAAADVVGGRVRCVRGWREEGEWWVDGGRDGMGDGWGMDGWMDGMACLASRRQARIFNSVYAASAALGSEQLQQSTQVQAATGSEPGVRRWPVATWGAPSGGKQSWDWGCTTRTLQPSTPKQAIHNTKGRERGRKEPAFLIH